MYSTYYLTEEEKANKFIVPIWDGDCMVYHVCDTKEEAEKEKARIDRINREAEQKYLDYLASLK